MWKAIGITCTVILYIFVFLFMIGLSVQMDEIEKRIDAIEKLQLNSIEYFDEQNTLSIKVLNQSINRIKIIEKKLHIKSH